MKRPVLALGAVLAGAVAIAACQAAPATPSPAATTAPSGTQPPAAATAAATAPAAAATAAATAPAAAKPSGTLRVGLGAPPRSMDIMTDWSGTAGFPVNVLGDSLVEITYDGKLDPALASEWSVASDNKTWTFRLRPGVRFSNGAPVTAEDVKFSIDTYTRTDQPFPNATLRVNQFLESSAVVDANTVRVVARNVDAIFPRRLTFVPIVQKSSFESLTPQDMATRAPVSTGPFVLQNYELNQKLTYTANPNSWRPARVQTLEVNILPEQSSRNAALQTGAISINTIVSPDLADIARREGKQVLALPNASVVQVTLDSFSPQAAEPLKDRRVREAMNIGIDRPAIVNALLFGFGDAISGTIPDDVFGYGPLPARTVDVARARQLIRDAGAEGAQMAMGGAYAIGGGLTNLTAAQAIAGAFNQLGLRVEIEPIEFATYVTRYQGGQMPPLILFTMNGVYSDADGILQNFRDQTQTNRAIVRYSNPEFDRAYIASTTETDSARRAQLLQQATRILYDDYANVPIGVTRSQFVYDGNRVQNFNPWAAYYWNWADITVSN